MLIQNIRGKCLLFLDNSYAYIKSRYDGMFIGLSIDFGIFLIFSIQALLKAIDDKRNYEEYSKYELITAITTIVFNIVSLVLCIVGATSNSSDTQHSLLLTFITPTILYIISISIYLGLIAERKRKYDGSNKYYAVCAVFDVIILIFNIFIITIS